MKRTNITTLVLLALIGGIGGGFIETLLAAAGRPIVLPRSLSDSHFSRSGSWWWCSPCQSVD